nr:unnamed protein product [Digitaria exilis]
MEEATRKKPTRRERRIERKIREAKKNEEQLAKYEEWKKRRNEEEARNRDPEKHTDFYAYQARKFEKFWNTVYSSHYGRFEDNSELLAITLVLDLHDPYLLLTGPVRGVVRGGPVTFEVSLYAKGTTESDDKELNLVASSMGKCWSHLWDSYLNWHQLFQWRS